MPYLFDTDAISNLLRPRPLEAYVDWLATVERDEQFTSAVALGELFKGAFRSTHRERHLKNIEERVLPRLTVLPFDSTTARIFGHLQAELEQQGQRLADADLQIGATAIQHRLKVVTGNLRHFQRIPGLEIETVFADALVAGPQ